MAAEHRRLWRRLADERGSVEAVIIFPVAIVIILLLVQGALYFLGRAVAADAAQDGARAAAAYGATANMGSAAATSALRQLAGPLLAVTSVSSTRGVGQAQVSVSAHVETILPGLSIPVNASATSTVEVFRP